MKPWHRPTNYIGATWNGWLVFLSRNRDSSLLENHNFETALAVVNPLAVDVPAEDARGVQVVRESHWAVGWVEWIAIHESNVAAILAAELLEAKLENYPILSEMGYNYKLYKAYHEAWKSYGHREFIRELEQAELIEEGACDGVDPQDSQQAFEALIPSGEYYSEDGSPNIRLAIERAKRDGLSESVCQFLNLQFEKAS